MTKQKISRGDKIKYGVIGALALVLVGVLTTAGIISSTRVSLEDQIAVSKSSIRLVNDKLTKFDSKNAKNQYMLSANGKANRNTASFLFQNANPDPSAKVVDVFVDLGEIRSRDALMVQSSLLKSVTEAGKIKTRINLIVGGSAYSALAANAFAEASQNNPENSWTILTAMVRQAAADASADSDDAIANKIAETIKRADDSSKIDGKTIRDGRFVEWLLTVHENENLHDGVPIPLVLFDGSKLQVKDDNYNDAEQFSSALLKKVQNAENPKN